jgi:hypothetical protein
MMPRIQIPGLQVAGPDDLKELQPREVPMDYRWNARFNQRTLTEAAKNVTSRVDHLKFAPDIENGLLYVIPADSDEYGAEQLDYEETENAATVSLYIALLKFRLPRQKGRVRIFSVEDREVAKGLTLLALNVRDSKLAPKKSRGGGSEEESSADTKETAPAQNAAEAKSAPPAESNKQEKPAE